MHDALGTGKEEFLGKAAIVLKVGRAKSLAQGSDKTGTAQRLVVVSLRRVDTVCDVRACRRNHTTQPYRHTQARFLTWFTHE